MVEYDGMGDPIPEDDPFPSQWRDIPAWVERQEGRAREREEQAPPAEGPYR